MQKPQPKGYKVHTTDVKKIVSRNSLRRHPLLLVITKNGKMIARKTWARAAKREEIQLRWNERKAQRLNGVLQDCGYIGAVKKI